MLKYIRSKIVVLYIQHVNPPELVVETEVRPSGWLIVNVEPLFQSHCKDCFPNLYFCPEIDMLPIFTLKFEGTLLSSNEYI